MDVNYDQEDEDERIDHTPPPPRLKSAQRLKYEAEVRSLTKKVGNLEDMRAQLGLTKRKMAQLLLVDPSAWSRWTKQEEDAPPVIYRALQWYLALNDKYPSLDVGFWLQTIARPTPNLDDRALAEAEKQRSHRLEALEAEVQRLRRQLDAPLAAMPVHYTRGAQPSGKFLKWEALIVAAVLGVGIAIGHFVR